MDMHGYVFLSFAYTVLECSFQYDSDPEDDFEHFDDYPLDNYYYGFPAFPPRQEIRVIVFCRMIMFHDEND